MSQLDVSVRKYLDEPVKHSGPAPGKEKKRTKPFARDLAAGVKKGYVGEQVFFCYREDDLPAFCLEEVLDVPGSKEYIELVHKKWSKELCPAAHLMIDHGYMVPVGLPNYDGGKCVLTEKAFILTKPLVQKRIMEFILEVRAQSLFMKFLLLLSLKDIYEIVSSIL